SQRSGQAVLIATLKRRISLLVARTERSGDADVGIEVLKNGIVLKIVDELEQPLRERFGHLVKVRQKLGRLAAGLFGVKIDAHRAEVLVLPEALALDIGDRAIEVL